MWSGKDGAREWWVNWLIIFGEISYVTLKMKGRVEDDKGHRRVRAGGQRGLYLAGIPLGGLSDFGDALFLQCYLRARRR